MEDRNLHLGITLIDVSVTEFPYDLKNVATQDFGNLTAIYIMENEEGFAFITKDFCEMNHISVDELHMAALDEQRKWGGYSINSMRSVLTAMAPELAGLSGTADEQMFVVTLDNAFRHGASVILQPEVLIAIEELLGKDFYIIPSSIHEVLVIPDDGDVGMKAALDGMVKEINEIEVPPDERLSDQVIRGSEFIRLLEAREGKIDRRWSH